MNEFNKIDIVVDESLDFQEPFKDCETQVAANSCEPLRSLEAHLPTEMCISLILKKYYLNINRVLLNTGEMVKEKIKVLIL